MKNTCSTPQEASSTLSKMRMQPQRDCSILESGSSFVLGTIRGTDSSFLGLNPLRRKECPQGVLLLLVDCPIQPGDYESSDSVLVIVTHISIRQNVFVEDYVVYPLHAKIVLGEIHI